MRLLQVGHHKQLHKIQVGLTWPSSDSNPTSTPRRLYVFIIAGVAAGVGSAVGVLTLAIMIALIVTAGILVAKSCKEKGECHLGLFWGRIMQYNSIFHTANVNSEEPYYSTMKTGQPDIDVIVMKENDAYGRPLSAQQEFSVEENPAYDVTGEYCT